MRKPVCPLGSLQLWGESLKMMKTLIAAAAALALMTPLCVHAATPADRAPAAAAAPAANPEAEALVRRYLWTQTDFPLSPPAEDRQQIPPALADHLADLLAYAA